MSTHILKVGDTGVLFTDTLTMDGLPINLTGGTVALIIRRRDATTYTTRVATVVAPLLGTVKYQPIAADVATLGAYDLEWVVTLSGGGVVHVPTEGMIVLHITPNITA